MVHNGASIGDRLKPRFFSRFTKMEATTKRLLGITYSSPRCSPSHCFSCALAMILLRHVSGRGYDA